MTELTTRENGGYVIPAGADILQFDYRQLVESGEAYQIPGFGLVSDKSLLIGVPHIIVGVTFQMPLADKANEFGFRDYVTLRGMIGDQIALDEALERNWVPGGRIPFKPNELICYNDGSTGIRREVVNMLNSTGLIKVGDVELPTSNPLDKPWTQWEEFSQSVVQGENTVPEFMTNHNGNQFLIRVMRGLRASAYTNEYGDSVTYYL